jgi:hypothetical protein
MYKLRVISGPNRGSSYVLQEGELSVGRQSGNSVVLQSSKVSKRHCVFQMRDDEVVVRDLGSSNGTFVNGVLIKARKIKIGDRISIGEFVFELVEPAKRSLQSAPAVAGFGNVLQFPGSPSLQQSSSMQGEMPAGMGSGIGDLGNLGSAESMANQPPKSLKDKIIWAFEHHFMPIFYGLNLKHEWKVLCMGALAAFVLGNLVISVYPLLESSHSTIIKETALRAKFMARQIAEQNGPFLAARAETKTDIGIVENAEGVRVALLTDLENRIIAPGSKLNQYLATGVEANLAIKARDLFRAGKETGFTAVGDPTTVVAIEPVKVLSPSAGRNIVVAMAIVSIDTSLVTPDLGEMGVVYAETLILTGILGGLLFLVLYRLTLKPFQVLNEDMDKALKGDLSQVTHQFKFEELNPLWELINSAIQRIPKGNADGSSMASSGPPSAEDCVAPLQMLGELAKFGFVIFDSEKKLLFLNSVFEEMSGIRSDSSLGRAMSEVARDQAMAAFTSDVLDRAPVGGQGVSEDFDFSGITYKMHAAAFGFPGNQAKCFVLAAIRVEG